MAKGGPRARSGPAPTSMERSHKAKADAQGWTALPPDGRDGALPDFPLIDPQPREWEHWERLWCKPQAVMWEQLHLDYAVALYVRALTRAELPRSSSVLLSTVKQMGEDLGLSPSGMQRNRWTIGAADAEPADTRSAPAGVASLADRLKALG